MARKSTTLRITNGHITLIKDACTDNAGVIVRKSGTEMGVTAVSGNQGMTEDGWINLRECTIPRLTVETLAEAA